MTFKSISVLLGLIFACASDGTATLPSSTSAVVANYASLVEANYADARLGTQRLNVAVQAFLAEPTAERLQAARAAWTAARPAYLQTEVFRFYGGPIEAQDGAPEDRINGWPLDEQTVDYVVGMSGGRIADPAFVISQDVLRGENGQGGEADIATGWHAIEFLLWGQDVTAPGERMPGQRPFTDYTTAEHAMRRASYLREITSLLETDMQNVHSQWAATGDNYRRQFVANERDALQKILTGMIIFSGFEMGGERMQAALDAGDQEEEHSCFSDTTHIDVHNDLVGIRNVWEGTYTRADGTMVSGPGIRQIVQEVDAALATRLDTALRNAVAAEALIPVPFDLAIVPGNPGNEAVAQTIAALLQFESGLSELFLALGFTVPVVQEE